MSQLRERLQAQPGGSSSQLFGTPHLPGVSPSSALRGQQRGGLLARALTTVSPEPASAKGERSHPPLQEKWGWS